MHDFTNTQDPDPVDVLLVEDNPDDVRLTKEAFADTGCETSLHAEPSGDDALEFLTRAAADESLPVLVLLDLNLPGRDGCDALEAIRNDPHLAGLPVLTSSGAADDVVRCYEARANAYLTKPTTLEEFTSVLRAVEQFRFERARLPPVPA